MEIVEANRLSQREVLLHGRKMPKKQQAKNVTIEKEFFMALHSAARALFQQSIKTDNHSAESVAYLTILDAAIERGHQVLGTHRPSADKYIELITGITEIQRKNAEAFLESFVKEDNPVDKVEENV